MARAFAANKRVAGLARIPDSLAQMRPGAPLYAFAQFEFLGVRHASRVPVAEHSLRNGEQLSHSGMEVIKPFVALGETHATSPITRSTSRVVPALPTCE